MVAYYVYKNVARGRERIVATHIHEDSKVAWKMAIEDAKLRGSPRVYTVDGWPTMRGVVVENPPEEA